MAKAAANHAPTFVSAGLPADFLVKLQEATDVLNASLADRGHTATTGTGATKGRGDGAGEKGAQSAGLAGGADHR